MSEANNLTAEMAAKSKGTAEMDRTGDVAEKAAAEKDVAEKRGCETNKSAMAESGAMQDAAITAQLGRQKKVRIRIASGRDSHE